MEKQMDDGTDEAGKPLEPIETSGLGIYEDHLMNLPPVVVDRFNMTYERFMSEGAPETPLLKAKMWNMPELLCPYCNELARRKFLQDSAHEEVFMFFKSDEEYGQLAFVQPPEDMDRESFYRVLRNNIMNRISKQSSTSPKYGPMPRKGRMITHGNKFRRAKSRYRSSRTTTRRKRSW